MPNHAPNGGVAETAVSLSAGAEPIQPAPDADSETSHGEDAKRSAKDEARKAEKQARKAAREQEKIARAEAKEAEKQRKKANEKTEAAVVEKAAKARSASEEDSESSRPSKPKGRKLRFEGSMDREEVASYLEAITKGLRKGSIHFRQGEDGIELTPNERVALSVKVSSKGDAQRLALEVEWDDETSPELAIVVG